MLEENEKSNPSSSLKTENDDPNPNSSSDSNNSDDDAVLDVSGQNLEFPLLKSPKTNQNRVKDLFLYKNEFNLLPSWVAEMRKLKTLKYFANEVKLFPVEFANLSGLECLQVKISPPGLNGFALRKLKDLKELELSRVLRGPSILPMLSEIAQLKRLTKLSVCHFSIKCLPPEIGCLDNLEYLDLSFNKMKSLPNEITYLNSLISLKVANNKLVELPTGLSSLQQLRFLDLSNNRLTSLGSLDLASMHNLHHLNLQFNKLLDCQVPPWICCDLSGNGTELVDSFTSSSVAMDVYDETTINENDRGLSYNGSCHSSSLLPGSLPSSRCYSARRSSKRWKRRHYFQQKARQERLNCSRKWKGEKYTEELVMSSSEICKAENIDSCKSKRIGGEASKFVGDDDDNHEKASISREIVNEGSLNNVEEDEISLEGTLASEKHSRAVTDSTNEVGENQHGDGASAVTNDSSERDDELLQMPKTATKPKRHCEKDLDNPKPCKTRRPVDETSDLSRKYNDISLCSFEDYLADGFYDAGRDRPFLSLGSYEQILPLESREVILLDRKNDEVLDAIVLSARALIHHFEGFKALTKDGEEGGFSNLQIASLLALFVSDHFGGCDRTAIVERMRKAVSGSNYQKPFICTCSTGNRDFMDTSADQILLNDAEDIVFSNLCERSLQSIKTSRNSIIVPIGTLKFGVCRHRALLMKYLCDRMEPPVPCEIVRGYLDHMPHAWNVVLVKKGNLLVRMLVDACRPHDIREETDPEYFSRYVPLYRGFESPVEETTEAHSSFPMSMLKEIKRAGSTSLVHCTYDSVDLVAKVRTLEVCGSSYDEIRHFDYSCLGEVRILGVLKHSCIVEMHGHRLSSKWLPSDDGNSRRRILEYAIYMEYIRGGSLKDYMDKLSKSGEKHVAADLAMFIARDVAFALSELHSRHIIHRDVKSENILVDLDEKRADGTPTVKLCDFDRAVPLRSILHSCCIAHTGIPPPNVCVGTPRWMAPEVLQAMNQHKSYGLEVDIWSYGCLLFELLTLQIPYSDSSESVIPDLIQRGKRPKLTDEIEALVSLKETAEDGATKKSGGSEIESETLRFLVDLFCKCTEKNPSDRPSAKEIYESTCAHASKLISNHS